MAYNKTNWEDLPSTDTPIDATNLQNIEDGIEEAHNLIDEIKEAEIYSTNEVKTNKVWIDGKPIYRKVISMGNLLNSDSLFIAHGISNIEFISNVIMFAIRESDCDRLTIPYTTFNANNLGGINGYANDTNVVITTSSNRTAYKGYTILEYTKTTD